MIIASYNDNVKYMCGTGHSFVTHYKTMRGFIKWLEHEPSIVNNAIARGASYFFVYMQATRLSHVTIDENPDYVVFLKERMLVQCLSRNDKAYQKWVEQQREIYNKQHSKEVVTHE